MCLLGYDTANKLFVNGENPIGKEVNVETGLYTVIGVLDKRKQLFGSGQNPQDNAIYFPMGTFHNLHPEALEMFLTVKYDDPANRSLVEEEVREMMRIRRNVKISADDNFDIFGTDSINKLWEQITRGLFGLMVAVSSVGLMVGGVGVMNIMLVSVTERTREIGIRKAIGATKHTILTQFTTEAVTLCAVGGVVGVIMGAALTGSSTCCPSACRPHCPPCGCSSASASPAPSACSSASILHGRPPTSTPSRRSATSNPSSPASLRFRPPYLNCEAVKVPVMPIGCTVTLPSILPESVSVPVYSSVSCMPL